MDTYLDRKVEGGEEGIKNHLYHGSTAWMQELDQQKALRHAMHVDVSVAREHVEKRLEAALAAGGRVVDDSHAPSHWTIADRPGGQSRLYLCLAGRMNEDARR